jgi:hypothetical protein
MAWHELPRANRRGPLPQRPLHKRRRSASAMQGRMPILTELYWTLFGRPYARLAKCRYGLSAPVGGVQHNSGTILRFLICRRIEPYCSGLGLLRCRGPARSRPAIKRESCRASTSCIPASRRLEARLATWCHTRPRSPLSALAPRSRLWPQSALHHVEITASEWFVGRPVAEKIRIAGILLPPRGAPPRGGLTHRPKAMCLRFGRRICATGRSGIASAPATGPTADRGPIPEAPGETWGAVEHALHDGLRGHPGGDSLAQFGRDAVKSVPALWFTAIRRNRAGNILRAMLLNTQTERFSS